MAMGSLLIAHLLQQDRLPQFCGVFPSDKLPQQPLAKPSALVVNTDPSSKPGQHWVAFYFDVDNTGDFFDSFGQPPTPQFMTFIRGIARSGSGIKRDCRDR